MTGQVINFRQARKKLVRKAAEQQATENRVRFGRTKTEKAREALDQARLQRELDGAKRDGD